MKPRTITRYSQRLAKQGPDTLNTASTKPSSTKQAHPIIEAIRVAPNPRKRGRPRKNRSIEVPSTELWGKCCKVVQTKFGQTVHKRVIQHQYMKSLCKLLSVCDVLIKINVGVPAITVSGVGPLRTTLLLQSTTRPFPRRAYSIGISSAREARGSPTSIVKEKTRRIKCVCVKRAIMSAMILSIVNPMVAPVNNLVVKRVTEYLHLIKSYDDNMRDLLKELNKLSSMKLDIDAKVMEGKERLRVMTRETANWLRDLQALIERDEIKKLMKEERVAEVAMKMMEQRLMKKLLKDDRDTFDIIVRVVKKKCNQEPRDGEATDPQEDADYKKVAKIASEVMKDIVEEFKKFMKKDDVAVAGVKLLNDEDLEKLRKDDGDMAKILSKAEGISRKEFEHNINNSNNHNEADVQPVNNSIIKEKIGSLRKHIGSLMDFLDDENFKKDLPDGAKLGLEVMAALSKSAGSDQIEGGAKQHKYCGFCVVRFKGYRHQHDMSRRAEVMVKAIKSMIEECPQGHVTRPKRADEREDIPSDTIDFESREDLLKKILAALKDDQVNVVGVFGMGGVGKTTLAKDVANKRAIGLFDKRIFVEVSESPDIKGIQDQIAEGINFSLDDVHTVAQRALKLYNALISQKVKKILIILDNIWGKLKLEEVGIPQVRTKDSCCKLLITTRERQTCKVMDVEDAFIFPVDLLNEREALNLFENQVCQKIDGGEFKPVVTRLLRKCGRLPLTIVATAGAIKGKDLSAWCHFADESEKPISSQIRSDYREAYRILETSYKLIEVEEKRIFFFLACLSPLDSAISVDDLMRNGIGLNLFQLVDKLPEAMEQANEWTKELLSSSLLLKGDIDGQVRIHDVVRESAISFFEKDKKDSMILVERIPRWMSEETFRKVTAISLLSGHDFSRLSGVEAPVLEILLLKGDIFSTTFSSDFFGGMTNLKVLSLSNIDFRPGLPKSMEQLERLKTLHLQQCKLKDIKLIGKLVNLLVLSLHGSTLEGLADEIGELCKLRLLDMGDCKGKISIRTNILSRLSCLEGLYLFNSFDDWAPMNNEANDVVDEKASVTELTKLSHLNLLEMEVPKLEQLWTLKDDHFVEQLGNFRIHVGSFLFGVLSGRVLEVNKKCFKKGSQRVLELNDIDLCDNKCFRMLLKKTDCLEVIACRSLPENLAPQLEEEGFKELKYFVVRHDDNIKFIISNKQKESMAFANLEILYLGYLKNLKMICDGKAPAGIFSNLQSLNLYELPNLKYGLPLTLVPPILVEVYICSCQSLKFIFVMQSEVEKETDSIELRFLKTVELNFVSSLSSICGVAKTIDNGEQVGKPFFKTKDIFPSLDSFKLVGNETAVALWSKPGHVSSFQNLKTMDIYRCTELKSLGSPSLFAALVHLEKMSIVDCYKLEEVITKETEGEKLHEHVIIFPHLKELAVSRTPILERFYEGRYKLEFPILKSLRLSNAQSLTSFITPERCTALFSDKIEFPCLETLEVKNVSNEVESLWNWSSSAVHGESESSGNVSLNPVRNLQNLTLGSTLGLTSIPPSVSHNLSYLEVVSYDGIKTLFSTSSANREVSLWTYSLFPKLEKLYVCNCSVLVDLFENEDDGAAISLCGQLTEITLCYMPKLKMVPLRLLQNLRSLLLLDINWENVFPADLFASGQEHLQLLEALLISNCKNMQVIVMNNNAVDGEEQVYTFPRLKKFFVNYSSITSFAFKPSSALHFPSLEELHLRGCSEVQSFASGSFRAPKLKSLEITDCYNLQYFLSENMNNVQEFPSLENLIISHCPKMLSFSSKPIAAPKLHDVSLEECLEMKWFSRGDPHHDNILELPSLESVKITNCAGMQSFSQGRIKAPKLCKLQINGQEYSKLANEDLENLLENRTSKSQDQKMGHE